MTANLADIGDSLKRLPISCRPDALGRRRTPSSSEPRPEREIVRVAEDLCADPIYRPQDRSMNRIGYLAT
jgi:hypothetical protein